MAQGQGFMDTNAKTDTVLKAIKKLGQEFFAAVNAGDLDRRMATMDPDIIIMPPDRPCMVGKEEIRRLSYDYSAVYDEKCSLFYDEIETAGRWGFVRATVTGTRTTKSDGGVEKVNLKNLWIVRRQPDGEWKFWRIMFNSTLP
jgi:ketosteroid isomerase-like protein